MHLPHVHLPKADVCGKSKANLIFHEMASQRSKSKIVDTFWYSFFETNALESMKNAPGATFEEIENIENFQKSAWALLNYFRSLYDNMAVCNVATWQYG